MSHSTASAPVSEGGLGRARRAWLRTAVLTWLGLYGLGSAFLLLQRPGSYLQADPTRVCVALTVVSLLLLLAGYALAAACWPVESFSRGGDREGRAFEFSWSWVVFVWLVAGVFIFQTAHVGTRSILPEAWTLAVVYALALTVGAWLGKEPLKRAPVAVEMAAHRRPVRPAIPPGVDLLSMLRTLPWAATAAAPGPRQVGKPATGASRDFQTLLEKNPLLRENLWWAGVDDLYHHQARVFHQLEAPESAAFLCTPAGSGKSTVCDLCALDTVLRPCRNVLYLVSDEGWARFRAAELTGRIEKMKWNWSVNVALCCGPGDRGFEDACARLGAPPEVLVSTPEGLDELLLNTPLALSEKYLSHLGLVVLDDAERFGACGGGHAACLLRRVRLAAAQLGASPRTLAACAPIANAKELADRLLGSRHEASELICEDGSPKSGISVEWWRSEAGAGAAGEKAGGFLSDAVRIAAHFTGLFPGRTLLYHPVAPITVDEEKTLTLEVFQELRKKRVSQLDAGWADQNICVTADLARVGRETFGSFWVIVVASLPADPPALFPVLQNLLAEGGLAVICLEPTPAGRAIARQDGDLDHASATRLVFNDAVRSVQCLHLRRALVGPGHHEGFQLETLRSSFPVAFEPDAEGETDLARLERAGVLSVSGVRTDETDTHSEDLVGPSDHGPRP
ncbi:MAG: DEAD/DEAH box helicase [Candidatus Riflebacteria bacterium]|nr:DEAD/DEAH box helicase [Candidatus Riflebacteria bacterium]